MKYQQKGDMMKNFRFFFGFIFDVFRKNKIYLIAKVFLAILQGVFPVITTILPQYLLDSILIDRNITYFISYTTLFVCLQFFVPFIYSILGIWLDKLLFKVNVQITNDMLDSLYCMKYEYYDNPETSNIFNRAFNFSTGSGVSTLNVFLEMIALTITLFSYAYIIAKFNYIILLIVIISIVINYCLMIKRTKINVSFNNEQTLSQRRIGYYKSLILNKYQAREMHFCGTFAYVKNGFVSESNNYNNELFRKNKKVFALNQIGAMFQGILTLVIMVSFGNMLYENIISVGEYTVSLNASMQFSNIVFSFINLVSNVCAGILESKNYREFKELTCTEFRQKAQCTLHEEFNVEFNRVSYRYFGTSTNALDNFSYKFCKGKIYAILGCNGSGKSTLIKLLLGLYKPSTGNIKIGDIRLDYMDDIDLKSYYNNFSVVSQDFQFIDGISIRENIGIVSKKEEEKFVELTKRYTFPNMTKLDNDFSKSFNENGLELSGGEKQKLAIIRALVRNRKIVVFDEPTSAIDIPTEEKLFLDLEKEKIERLTIVVTHNHRMAKYADEVLILNNGYLIAHDSYENLVKYDFIKDV